MDSTDYYWILASTLFLAGLCFSMYKKRLFGFYVGAAIIGSLAQHFTQHTGRLFFLAVVAVALPALMVLILTIRDKFNHSNKSS